MSPRPVAVIDIGSNTIKLLVAIRDDAGGLLALATKSKNARISAGISRESPRLSAEGMAKGVGAIRDLAAAARPYDPVRVILVATSAVRDAENGPDFCAQIHAATGHEVRILTGDEEAALIGRGLGIDPALRQHRDFYSFDLGGGSLECLAFRDRRIDKAASLPLGCVRLAERFVADAQAPMSRDQQEAIAAHTRRVLGGSTFQFGLGAGMLAVGTGGTISTCRAILGARAGLSWEQTNPVVAVQQQRELLTAIGRLPLEDRKQVPGLPGARADVFPTALATLIAVAEAGGIESYHHSVYNLRYGLADQALDR